MPTIKIPDGTGGWLKLPTIKGEKGDTGNSGSGEWIDILNKPSTFPPGTHSHNDVYFTESEVTALLVGKAEASTLSGHTGSTTIHVTQGNKDTWNAKAEVSAIPTKLSDLEVDVELGGNFATIGTIKPTDGSMWYEEIV